MAPTARLFSPGRADPARRAQLDVVAPKLDAFFGAKMKESGATGFAVAVIVDGEPAYLRGFGVRDLAFALDRETGRVTTFEAHAPRAVDAACWP